MKHALLNGQLTPAAPDAPATAACPYCGSPVKLRVRQGTYFWRHMQLPSGGCPPPHLKPTAGDDRTRQMRQVGDFVIEWLPDVSGGPSLKLRRLGAERAGEPSGLVIPLRQVRHLAAALINAAVELVEVVVDRSSQGLNDNDDVPL